MLQIWTSVSGIQRITFLPGFIYKITKYLSIYAVNFLIKEGVAEFLQSLYMNNNYVS